MEYVPEPDVNDDLASDLDFDAQLKTNLLVADTNQITELVDAGYTDFFSGMAEGTDLGQLWPSLTRRRKLPH